MTPIWLVQVCCLLSHYFGRVRRCRPRCARRSLVQYLQTPLIERAPTALDDLALRTTLEATSGDNKPGMTPFLRT